MPTAFRFLRVFNDERHRAYAGTKTRVGRNCLPLFPEPGLRDRLVRELAAERTLPLKEITEAYEFFAVARKYLRRREALVDLAAGHGLAGLLFAAFEPRIRRVILCDRRRPKHFEAVWRAARRAAPWVADKVQYLEGDLRRTRRSLPDGAALIGVHACGALTDECLEIGLQLGGPLALLPCCRDHSRSPAPLALQEALGADVAYDVHRTYRLEAAGYRVRWRTIPEVITPMNRVLVAVPRASKQHAPAPAAPPGDGGGPSLTAARREPVSQRPAGDDGSG